MKKLLLFIFFILSFFQTSVFADILIDFSIGDQIIPAYYTDQGEKLQIAPGTPRFDLMVAYDPGHYFVGGEVGTQWLMDTVGRVGAIGGYYFIDGRVRPYIAAGVGYVMADFHEATLEYISYSGKVGVLGSIGQHVQMGASARYDYMSLIKSGNRSGDDEENTAKKIEWTPFLLLYEIGFKF
jgi:hypothetical protein